MEKFPNFEIDNFPKEISSKYEIIQEIGRGAFSIVYKVKSRENNCIYCLKKINTKKTKDKENEVKILSTLSHPNLIKCFYSFCDSENIYIIMDFCEFGDLFSLLQSVKKKKVFVNEDIIWNIAIQVLIGLKYLHSKKIIHRDIKLLNLFMTKDKKIKIGDMGMSTIVKEDELINSRVGTPLYIAPELVKKEKYDYKIDIWSLGCSLYHLAKTNPPFNDENLIKLGNAIINEQPPNLPICYSDELYDFILRLMVKNKDHRPSAKEALDLIPEKIKNKFYKINILHNIKKKKFIYENEKLIEKQNIINKSDKKIMKQDDTSNNKDINIFDKYISKSIKNKESKYEKELVSGQTFYQFFKMNNTKYKSKNKIIEINHDNNESTNNNNNMQNINLSLLSKTMQNMKDNIFKFKIHENLEKKTNVINNIKALKLIDNNNKNFQKNINKKYKEIEVIDNNNTDDKLKINNNNNELIFSKENSDNLVIRSEIYKHNIYNYKNDSIKNNRNISFLDGNIKNLHDFTKNFFVKEGINKNNTIIINKMNLINKRYQIECGKKETKFPKIQNRYKYKSSSLDRYKNHPEFQNFAITGYHNNFKSKLTIHDLK